MLVVLKPYVESELRIDLKKGENTLTVIEVDTLTEKDRLNLKGLVLLEELQVDHLPFIELQQYAVNQYMQLYKIHPVVSVRNEIDKAVREYSALQEKADPLILELEETVAKEKMADNKIFKAYKVNAVLRRQSSTDVIKTDTLSFIMTKELQILKEKEFINQ